jgi:hypothetical protein
MHCQSKFQAKHSHLKKEVQFMVHHMNLRSKEVQKPGPPHRKGARACGSLPTEIRRHEGSSI